MTPIRPIDPDPTTPRPIDDPSPSAPRPSHPIPYTPDGPESDYAIDAEYGPAQRY